MLHPFDPSSVHTAVELNFSNNCSTTIVKISVFQVTGSLSKAVGMCVVPAGNS